VALGCLLDSTCIFDQPRVGLHLSDIIHPLAIVNRLVDSANSVIVTEHKLDVIRNVDWIFDLGPEGDNKGGKVVFARSPMELLSDTHSLTDEKLARGAPEGA